MWEQDKLVEYTLSTAVLKETHEDLLLQAECEDTCFAVIRFETGFNDPLSWLPKIPAEKRKAFDSALADHGLTVEGIRQIAQEERLGNGSRRDYKAWTRRNQSNHTVRCERARIFSPYYKTHTAHEP